MLKENHYLINELEYKIREHYDILGDMKLKNDKKSKNSEEESAS